MVGKRARGGYECELDVVAFEAKTERILHIEPSMDADSWAKRERRYKKKFDAGRKYIPELFDGLLHGDLHLEQIALFGFGGKSQATLAGGKVMHVSEFLKEIADKLSSRTIARAAVPESFALLRTVQFTLEHVVNGPRRSSTANTEENS